MADRFVGAAGRDRAAGATLEDRGELQPALCQAEPEGRRNERRTRGTGEEHLCGGFWVEETRGRSGRMIRPGGTGKGTWRRCGTSQNMSVMSWYSAVYEPANQCLRKPHASASTTLLINTPFQTGPPTPRLCPTSMSHLCCPTRPSSPVPRTIHRPRVVR